MLPVGVGGGRWPVTVMCEKQMGECVCVVWCCVVLQMSTCEIANGRKPKCTYLYASALFANGISCRFPFASRYHSVLCVFRIAFSLVLGHEGDASCDISYSKMCAMCHHWCTPVWNRSHTQCAPSAEPLSHGNILYVQSNGGVFVLAAALCVHLSISIKWNGHSQHIRYPLPVTHRTTISRYTSDVPGVTGIIVVSHKTKSVVTFYILFSVGFSISTFNYSMLSAKFFFYSVNIHPASAMYIYIYWLHAEGDYVTIAPYSQYYASSSRIVSFAGSHNTYVGCFHFNIRYRMWFFAHTCSGFCGCSLSLTLSTGVSCCW